MVVDLQFLLTPKRRHHRLEEGCIDPADGTQDDVEFGEVGRLGVHDAVPGKSQVREIASSLRPEQLGCEAIGADIALCRPVICRVVWRGLKIASEIRRGLLKGHPKASARACRCDDTLPEQPELYKFKPPFNAPPEDLLDDPLPTCPQREKA
jgi:hypothetical protein